MRATVVGVRPDSLYYQDREKLVGRTVEVLTLHPAVLTDGYRYAHVKVLSGPLRGRKMYIVGVKLNIQGERHEKV